MTAIIKDDKSNSCGYFEKGTIPKYANLKKSCKSWVDVIARNVQPNSIHSGLSTIAMCQIYNKQPKENLTKFWNDLFQDTLKNYSPIFSCDPREINLRAASLN